MNYIEILLTSIALSMDAFAVSICKGLTFKKYSINKSLIIGIYFGVFQSLMPLIGYFLASNYSSILVNIDHYIAFILLSILGVDMILSVKEDNDIDGSLSFKKMISLSIATSIDALCVGITFAFLNTNIIIPIVFIGLITFIISSLGPYIGYKFGLKFKDKSQIFGGIILILIGIKILLEHLGIL